MGCGGGGGDSTSTQTVITVPEWARPTVAEYGLAAYNLWQAGTVSAFGGDIIASQNQDELDGIDGLANRGRYGDLVISKGITYLDEVINGGHLEGTKVAFLAALANVTGKSTTAFASVNARIGRKPYFVGDPDSTLLAQSLAAGYPALYNDRMSKAIYADNFAKERGIQNQALAYGVEMGKHAAIDAEALRRAGLYAREYLQGTYELSHKRFLEEQEVALVNLEIFGNALRALTGSQQTSTQSGGQAGNQIMSAVGMGVAGAVIGNMILPGLGGIIGFGAGAILGWIFG